MNILFKFIFVFVGLITSLLSVSAPPFSFEVEQTDGSKIPVRMYGHEYYNWMETEDGYVIDWVEDNTRLGWYYSELESEGKFSPTHILVQYPAPDYLEIPKHLREISPRVREFGHYNLHSIMNQNTHLDRLVPSSLIKPLVFLVDFDKLPSGMPDREYSKDQFQYLLFEENLNSNDAGFSSRYDMSVRDYYNEISNGNLDIYGDSESVVDWTTVDHEYSYYVNGAQGTGNGSHGMDSSAAALVVEIAMEHQSEIDFSDFDGNGDGDVDVVILIVEGWGEGDNDQFWPHMSLIQSGDYGIGTIDPSAPTNNDGYFSLDGVAIKQYIVITEQFHMDYWGASENDIHPIGTICHELGHVLGLPDLYDTSENSASGIGAWGLMGSGNWQRPTNPAYMSAWSRYRLGFIVPNTLEDVSNLEISILPAEGLDIGAAYILPMSPNLPQEYLIIENRQKIGSDEYLKKTGLLVWHIDETITDMYPALNSVNVNPDFYGVNLIQADADGDLYTHSGTEDSGDPFPGSSNNTQISTSTNPNSDLYTYDRDADGIIDSGGASNISLINISENSDNSITLTANNPNQQGIVLAYEEGGYEGIAYPDSYSLQWAGIRVVAPDTSLLSGIRTVFPPSSWTWDVTDYTINIWKGWTGNKPETLLYSLNGDVQWSPQDMRDGGWAYISFTEANLIWNKGETYYVEINFDGSGGVYPFEEGIYSSSQGDGMSYFRSNTKDNCILLTEIANGDWNIRVSLNPDFCNSGNDVEIYDCDGNCIVDVDCNGICNGTSELDVCGNCDGGITDDVNCDNIGCMDGGDTDYTNTFGDEADGKNACNYNADATMPGECVYPEENFDCDGNCTVETDCKGDCGGSAVVDECGECGGPGAIYECGCVDIDEDVSCDCDGNILDCNGICGGENKNCLAIMTNLIPENFILYQNYPNPFNPATQIRYDIPEHSKVLLRIYDITGREIAVLYNSYQTPGHHTMTWDASKFVSGLYILEINVTSGNKSIIFRDFKKILYIQ